MSKPNSLSEFCPELEECNVWDGENKIIVESKKSGAQVVLPVDSKNLLAKLNGKNSIQSIVALLYEEQGRVSFHSLFHTLRLLREAHLLRPHRFNWKNLPQVKNPVEQRSSWLIRPWFEWVLLPLLQSRYYFPKIFNIFAVMIITFALLPFEGGVFDFRFNGFLSRGQSYHMALFLFILGLSLLTSLKQFFRLFLSWMCTGQVFRLSIHFCFFNIGLHVSENAIYTKANKFQMILFRLASATLYLCVANLLGFVLAGSAFYNDIKILALLLTLVELNPYRQSELTRFFHFFYAEDQLNNLLPFLKNRSLTGLIFSKKLSWMEELRYGMYSLLALSWAVVFYLFASHLVRDNFPELFYEIIVGAWWGQFSALLILGQLVVILLYLFFDLAHTVFKNLIYPLLRPWRNLKNKGKNERDSKFDEDRLKKILKEHFVFGQLSDGALQFVIKYSRVKRFASQSYLMVQGTEGQHTYLLLEGSLEITKTEPTGLEKKIVDLMPYALVGETAILQKTLRSANVLSSGDSIVLEMHEDVFKRLMNTPQFFNDYLKLKTKIEISHFISATPLFAQLPKEVANLFVEVGEMCIFPAGAKVVEQGESDKTFYLLIRGSVKVVKDGVAVAQLGQGDFFGEVALLADVKRTATVETLEESLFLFIESKEFWQILSTHLPLGMQIETMGLKRMNDESSTSPGMSS